MANITPLLQQIATGVWAEDVRTAIHDAIEAVNNDLPNSANVSMEVVTARTPDHETLETYTNLKDRLDGDYDELKTYVNTKSTPGTEAKIQISNATVGYSSLKDRLDTEFQNLDNKYQRIKELELICEDPHGDGNIVLRLGGS